MKKVVLQRLFLVEGQLWLAIGEDAWRARSRILRVGRRSTRIGSLMNMFIESCSLMNMFIDFDEHVHR
jgi:hypothetical protein